MLLCVGVDGLLAFAQTSREAGNLRRNRKLLKFDRHFVLERLAAQHT